MKNKTFFQSVCCAFSGLSCALKTEKNFKYYLGIAAFLFLVNMLLRVNLILHILYIIPIFGVFSAELLNTAVEHLCNRISPDISPEIRVIKDIGAGAVLFWGFGFFTVESIIILSTVFGVNTHI